ncbi:MAG: gamma carbonic anhydrase family protein [Deltaproteobacteria bacterium]|nr:gamma carbonic anhydrase family protein [Deltaproteobacteria bacterium]
MIYEYKGMRPKLGKNVFLAPGVILLGDVEIGDNSNLWFYTVARGDVNSITIGQETNIQDHCMLHVTFRRWPLRLGNRVVVGHRAALHGCAIHDDVLVGIGALVLDGAVVEHGAIVAAGAVVAPGTIIPANRVAVGIPARPTREAGEEDRATHQANLARYQDYARNFSELVSPVFEGPDTAV